MIELFECHSQTSLYLSFCIPIANEYTISLVKLILEAFVVIILIWNVSCLLYFELLKDIFVCLVKLSWVESLCTVPVLVQVSRFSGQNMKKHIPRWLEIGIMSGLLYFLSNFGEVLLICSVKRNAILMSSNWCELEISDTGCGDFLRSISF